MSTDLVVMPSLAEQQEYAKALVYLPNGEASRSSLLPAAYRDNPSNVLIAMGLGYALGLSPAQALYEIHVIEGRPAASANLMAALVRRAGHKLRIAGTAEWAQATLVRADDPDNPFVAEWTLDDAKRAGLLSKTNWTRYQKAMLRARAISDVCRAGASEALLGMEYSREELEDVDEDTPPERTVIQSAPTGNLRAAVKPRDRTQADEPEASPEQPTEAQAGTPDVVDAEEVTEPETEPDAPAEPEQPFDGRTQMTASQRGRIFALFAELGITDEDEQRAGMAHVIGRPVESRGQLSGDEAKAVIARLEEHKAELEEHKAEREG